MDLSHGRWPIVLIQSNRYRRSYLRTGDEQLARSPEAGPRYSPLGGPPYPEGLDTPRDRYYTRWGLYPDQPYILNPPWSSIVAYDLNLGTVKWKVPFGQDATAAAQGAKNTGAFMAEHDGMIVTATGLMFVAASDGKLRAYDEDTGAVLWTKDLPAAAQGIPAMFELAGRQCLVIARQGVRRQAAAPVQTVRRPAQPTDFT